MKEAWAAVEFLVRGLQQVEGDLGGVLDDVLHELAGDGTLDGLETVRVLLEKLDGVLLDPDRLSSGGTPMSVLDPALYAKLQAKPSRPPPRLNSSCACVFVLARQFCFCCSVLSCAFRGCRRCLSCARRRHWSIPQWFLSFGKLRAQQSRDFTRGHLKQPEGSVFRAYLEEHVCSVRCASSALALAQIRRASPEILFFVPETSVLASASFQSGPLDLCRF